MSMPRIEMPLAVEIAMKHCLSMDKKEIVEPDDIKLFLAISTLILHARDTNTTALIDLSVDANRQTQELFDRLTKGA